MTMIILFFYDFFHFYFAVLPKNCSFGLRSEFVPEQDLGMLNSLQLMNQLCREQVPAKLSSSLQSERTPWSVRDDCHGLGGRSKYVMHLLSMLEFFLLPTGI